MSAAAPRPRLATDQGRCVIRIPRKQRLAGGPVADAARQKRALAEIYLEGLHVYDAALGAEQVADAALAVSSSNSDPVVRLALAREASRSAGLVAARLSNLLAHLERVSGRLPCR